MAGEPTRWAYNEPYWEPIGSYHIAQSQVTEEQANVTVTNGSATLDVITDSSGTFPADGGSFFYLDEDPVRSVYLIESWGAGPTIVANARMNLATAATYTLKLFRINEAMEPQPEFRKCQICGRVWPILKLRRSERNDRWTLVCPQDDDAPGPNDSVHQDEREERYGRVVESEGSFWFDLEGWL